MLKRTCYIVCGVHSSKWWFYFRAYSSSCLPGAHLLSNTQLWLKVFLPGSLTVIVKHSVSLKLLHNHAAAVPCYSLPLSALFILHFLPLPHPWLWFTSLTLTSGRARQEHSVITRVRRDSLVSRERNYFFLQAVPSSSIPHITPANGSMVN